MYRPDQAHLHTDPYLSEKLEGFDNEEGGTPIISLVHSLSLSPSPSPLSPSLSLPLYSTYLGLPGDGYEEALKGANLIGRCRCCVGTRSGRGGCRGSGRLEGLVGEHALGELLLGLLEAGSCTAVIAVHLYGYI